MLQELSSSIVAPGHSVDVVSNGNTIWFDCVQPNTGMEICQTDGTVTGTMLTVDLMPGVSASQPRSFAYVDSTLYVLAEGLDGSGTNSGHALWSMMETLQRSNSTCGQVLGTIQMQAHMDYLLQHRTTCCSLLMMVNTVMKCINIFVLPSEISGWFGIERGQCNTSMIHLERRLDGAVLSASRVHGMRSRPWFLSQ